MSVQLELPIQEPESIQVAVDQLRHDVTPHNGYERTVYLYIYLHCDMPGLSMTTLVPHTTILMHHDSP